MTRSVKTSCQDVPAFVTKDQSIIRELMHPSQHGNRNQSLAEATLHPGTATLAHRHRLSEEIYHITLGTGRMQLAEDDFDVMAGDTIHIPPGVVHAISNTGTSDLKLLCCSSPPYTHEDTEIVPIRPDQPLV